MSEREIRKPTTYTHVRGGGRSMQYYALRTRWEWTMSGKTRCWTTLMKETWGNDLDAITLLGIAPKPVSRDWQRFDEMRELVDLGRHRGTAEALFEQLKNGTEREHELRRTAGRRAFEEVPRQMADLIADAVQRALQLAERLQEYGVRYALRSDCDDAVEADYHAEWAKAIAEKFGAAKVLISKDANEATTTAKRIVAEHLGSVDEQLVTGASPGRGYNPITSAVFGMHTGSLVKWRKRLVEVMTAIEETERARVTIRERENLVGVAPHGFDAGWVSGTAGAP